MIACALLLAPVARAGETVLASVSSAGAPGSEESGSIYGRQSITPNGRYVSFDSLDGTLVTPDDNGGYDVFVRDLKKGTTILASGAMDGDPEGGGGLNARLSSNGRFVAFQSSAADLVADDANGTSDIFVRDVKKGVTTRVSVDSAGGEADGSSFNPWLSANGRYVVFQSDASDLVADDGNSDIDVFLHDRSKGTTVRVSVDSMGVEGNGDSLGPSISGNGRFVAFQSIVTTLVADDTNGAVDVFVRDIKKGVTVRVSVDGAGLQAEGSSVAAMIAGSGRFVAFNSDAANLVADDLGGHHDVFVRDLKKNLISRISTDAAGASGDAGSGFPWITANGRFVAFESLATNLVDDDANEVSDVFLHDMKQGTRRRASVDSLGAESDGGSARGAVSSNGRFVAFDSGATNLVADDGNGVNDVFVRDMKP